MTLDTQIKPKKFPKSPTRRGCVDEQACKQLGLEKQWKNVVLDERKDGTLICLSGYGEMLIRCPGKKNAYVLDLHTTAALCTFFDGDNTRRLIPAILRASLLATGSETVRDLVLWMDEHFAA